MAALSNFRPCAWLAPFVAAGMIAQDLSPELLLLARIKRHVRQELAQLPNYTCLETIARFRKELSVKMTPIDTVRLEIVYADHREWYGSPGERALTIDNPVQFIGSGMIGNGAFATSLINAIEGATFTYQGEELLFDRNTVKYSLHLPRLLRGSTITVANGSGMGGEDGIVWVDVQSLDLVRLDLHAVEIPPYLPVQESSVRVDYTRMKIGGNDVLLAQQADMHMLESNGVESYDRFDFTHCRAFSAESTLRFDKDPEDPTTTTPTKLQTTTGFPALLPITIRLISAVTDRDTVGTLIEGLVVGSVARKGQIILRDGAPVRGRIRRLERYRGNGQEEFIVGLEFTEVETVSGPMRFYADLMQVGRTPSIRVSLPEKVIVRNGTSGFTIKDSTVTLPELPGVASSFVSGSTFVIPKGFRMMWRTRASATPSK